MAKLKVGFVDFEDSVVNIAVQNNIIEEGTKQRDMTVVDIGKVEYFQDYYSIFVSKVG
jgi:hypothetical protein